MRSPLLLDGALGTMLELRGVDTRGAGWTSRANLTAPDLIRAIHEEYILAGADIITANTFRTNPRAHRPTGYDAHELTIRAIELAKTARENTNMKVRIAASIAPVEDCFSPERAPTDEAQLFEEHATLIRWAAEAGADLILIETMSTLREAIIALSAARATCALPVYVSFVARDADSLLDGTSIEDAVSKLRGADLLAINCTALSILHSASRRFINAAIACGVAFGVIPNAAEQHQDGSWELQASSDDAIAQESLRWAEMGASLVGSCCGTTPNTTEAIRRAIRSEV